MFWIQFWLNNAHFTVSLFAAVVSVLCTAVLLDSFASSRRSFTLTRAVAFALFFGYFLIHAAKFATAEALLPLATFLLFVSFVLDPLQKQPPLPGKGKGKTRASAQIIPFAIPGSSLVLGIAAELLILRKIFVGLEKELGRFSWGFGLFTLSLLLYNLRKVPTENILLAQAFSEFQIVWILEHLLLFLAVLLLAFWAYHYLRFRVFSQIFALLSMASLVIFVATTFFFTYLLFGQVQAKTLDNLKKNAGALLSNISNLHDTASLAANTAARSGSLVSAVELGKKDDLVKSAQELFSNLGVDSLVITDKDGVVLVRAENPEAGAESLSSNGAVASALLGEEGRDFTVKEGVLSPQVLLESSAPLFSSQGKILGAVLSGFEIDNAFLDGFKRETGLSASVYGGSHIAATTFSDPSGKSRFINLKEKNPKVIKALFDEGQAYLGDNVLFGREFSTAYLPFANSKGQVVGALFVGEEKTLLLAAVKKAVDATFAGVALLALFSFAPIWWVSKVMSKHLQV